MHRRLIQCLRLLAALAILGACSPAPAPAAEGTPSLPSVGPAPTATSISTTPGESGEVEMGFTSEGFPDRFSGRCVSAVPEPLRAGSPWSRRSSLSARGWWSRRHPPTC